MKTIAKILCGWLVAAPAFAQVPTVNAYSNFDNRLFLTVTTPYVGYTSWYGVWAEVPGTIIGIFTNNEWEPFDRCRYGEGIYILKVLCGHGEERVVNLLKGEVTCPEVSALGDITVKYARFVEWDIVEVGILYKIYTQGNKGFCEKSG